MLDNHRLAVLPLLACALAVGHAQAQSGAGFPAKPVRWLVGFAPGGGSSILSRLMAQKLNERCKAVSQMTAQPYILLVTGALPARSVEELIALAKAREGKLNYGS